MRGAETTGCYINGIGGRNFQFMKQIYQISYDKYHLSVKKKILNDFKHKLFATMAHAGTIKINIMVPAFILISALVTFFQEITVNVGILARGILQAQVTLKFDLGSSCSWRP